MAFRFCTMVGYESSGDSSPQVADTQSLGQEQGFSGGVAPGNHEAYACYVQMIYI